MLLNFFNLILIIFATFLTYKYFDLKEKLLLPDERYIAYLKSFSRFVDRLEGYEKVHAAEVADLAETIAVEMKLSADNINSLKIAAYLHDIGSLMLPKILLNSSKPLDKEQLFLVQTHPIVGEMQLRENAAQLDEVPSIIRWHHERWDGFGYPDNLCGEEIPISARILSFADAVVAMRNERPYRKALPEKKIKLEVDFQSGSQFDPSVVAAWKKISSQNKIEREK